MRFSDDINTYLALLIVTVTGAFATLLIVQAVSVSTLEIVIMDGENIVAIPASY